MILFNEKTRELFSNSGYISTKDKQTMYNSPIYLGIYSNESDYIEVSREEYEDWEIEKMIQEKQRRKLQGGA